MLKQLLQQLLNTRTTPGGAAHSASSTYTSPQWFNGTSTVGDKWTNGLYTGTAPNDGYLNISGSAYITTENVGSMIQAQIGDGQISQVSPMSGQGFNMLFPISKGASFSVNGIRLADITVRFFKSIGGGYNLLVRRALPCLRPSFNYLPKVFSRVKRNGLAVKDFHQAIRSRSQVDQPRGENTQHLVMATSISTQELTHRARSITVRFTRTMGRVSVFLLLPQVTRASLFLFARAKKSATTLDTSTTQKQARRIFTSLSPSAPHNLLSTGGALC